MQNLKKCLEMFGWGGVSVDPMLTVPLSLSEETVKKFGVMSICYEVHGKCNMECTSRLR